MKIESKRFGQVEVKEDRIIKLKGGLLGFSEMETFVLLDDSEDAGLPFKWLVSIEQPEHGFLVTDPGIFFKDYVFELPEDVAGELSVRSEDDLQVLTLLTVPTDPKMITANLKGPIVINTRTFEAKQVVLGGTDYVTKHYIFLEATRTEEEVQARATAEGGLVGRAAPGAGANTDVKSIS